MSERALPLDLGELGLDRGAHLLLGRALRALEPGATLEVLGSAPDLGVHLRAWARQQGHGFEELPVPRSFRLTRGAGGDRGVGAERAGRALRDEPGAIVEHPPARWGLAARGALVEGGAPELDWALDRKVEAWSDETPALYARAAASQWDPATAIDWSWEPDLPDEVEDAVVQVMTYLIENETAALVIPARFAGRVHPHFRETMQLLAIQAADEARHIEVFTRRATLARAELGLSTAGGQASLKTLLDESDFALASFLLSVLGEGSFLNLLWFLSEFGPDPVTRQITKLAAQDEARHVAFGLSHLQRHAAAEPGLLPRLAVAIRRRHDALRDTAGLNAEVFDALVLIAAGSFDPAAVARGHERVMRLQGDMHAGRVGRLLRLGFSTDDARALSELHTRNFM